MVLVVWLPAYCRDWLRRCSFRHQFSMFLFAVKRKLIRWRGFKATQQKLPILACIHACRKWPSGGIQYCFAAFWSSWLRIRHKLLRLDSSWSIPLFSIPDMLRLVYPLDYVCTQICLGICRISMSEMWNVHIKMLLLNLNTCSSSLNFISVNVHIFSLFSLFWINESTLIPLTSV
jgi:hypothetical protein